MARFDGSGRVIALTLVLLAGGCGGIALRNVGDPSTQTRLDFEARLDLVHPGMPVDSLSVLFGEALRPGQAGILRRTRLVTAAGESGSVALGWRSDPRHEIGRRSSRETEVERALVLIEGAQVVRIERRD
ncbi:hypothetical protein FJ251_05445 [bacterium]|nr:hypothetical protein [bacterium]